MCLQNTTKAVVFIWQVCDVTAKMSAHICSKFLRKFKCTWHIQSNKFKKKTKFHQHNVRKKTRLSHLLIIQGAAKWL